MIQITNVSKSYRGSNVVDNLSFSVEDGKVTGFVGNNGAGKTTTMNIMLGLKKMNNGNVLYDGKSLNHYANPAIVIGYVSSDDTFDKSLTVYEHLRSLSILVEIPIDRVNKVIEEIGLQEKTRSTIRKLSNGMKQKLKIASAILSEPKYLILDEPFNGLDPSSSKWLRGFLKSYVKTDGRVVFISSHILSELAQFIDNLIIIDDGRLVVQDTWQSIAKKYQNINLEDVFLGLIGQGETK